MSDEAFISKMHIFSREICEGFFAEKIILVEGVSDKAVLEGCYLANSRTPLSEGICIIPADGKTKMDKPFFVFDRLSIPVFAVFDSDANKPQKKQKPDSNHILQHVSGIDEIVDFPEGCYDKCYAFSQDLESYLISVAGEAFEEELAKVSADYGLSPSDLFKTPHAISRVVQGCRNRGATFPHLDRIIQAVDDL